MVSDMARRSEDKMRSAQGLATRERFDGQMEVHLTQGPKMIIVDFDYLFMYIFMYLCIYLCSCCLRFLVTDES